MFSNEGCKPDFIIKNFCDGIPQDQTNDCATSYIKWKMYTHIYLGIRNKECPQKNKCPIWTYRLAECCKDKHRRGKMIYCMRRGKAGTGRAITYQKSYLTCKPWILAWPEAKKKFFYKPAAYDITYHNIY